MNKRLRIGIAALFILALAGCSVFGPQTEPRNVTVPGQYGSIQIQHGYLHVGDADPSITQSQGTGYFEGAVEVDGELELDGALDADSTASFAGAVTMADDLTVSGTASWGCSDTTIEDALTAAGTITGQDLVVTDTVDVGGTANLDTVDIDDLVNITRETGTTGQYEDLITAEWTNSAADASHGSNGIYMSTNPIYDVNNAYGLRARLDMRGAGDSVDVNQLHGVDVCVNLNETQTYTVTDNISGVGAAIHGGTSNDIVTDSDAGTVNLFYGAWGETADQNLTSQTNGMLLLSHASTYVDYGIQIQSSSDMAAGLYLNNHSSNSPATMDYGVKMKSAASKMVDGINMEDADFTGADIVGDSGETIKNTTDTAWQIGGFLGLEEASVIDLGSGGTITPGASYQPITNSTDGSIDTSASTAIADGPVAGVILIICNEDAQDVVIKDGANTKIGGDVTLTGGADDCITLIWNGADWVGLSMNDN